MLSLAAGLALAQAPAPPAPRAPRDPSAPQAPSAPPAQTRPAPSAEEGLPPAEEQAKAALDKSPRHGEWVDVPMPAGGPKLRTWIVYPERKTKAPVVIVLQEIFGLTDWIRAVADRLADDGFIAVAPDMLSGRGPNGG